MRAKSTTMERMEAIGFQREFSMFSMVSVVNW